MLIWRGFGILVAVLAIVALVGAQLVADALGGEGTYSRDWPIYAGIGLALAGVVAFLLGRRLNDDSNARTLVDKETGEEVVDRPRHDLFWIPMEFWGIAGVVLGLGAFLYGLIA